MNIFRSLTDITGDFGEVVATMGNFDGVHCGHRLVFDRVLARARALGLRSLAITFDPHPVRILRPDAPHALITPLEQKLDLLARTGLHGTLVLPFDLRLSKMTARDFATEILRDRVRAIEFHEGENFRFGYQASAGMQDLAELGRELDFTVHAYAPHILRGGPISSSRIRRLIADGKLSEARALLGRSFSLRSTPAAGRGYGTRFTVPTINLAPYAELLPANGVYVTEMTIGRGPSAQIFGAVTNVGNRPTFGEDSFTVESHLLNFRSASLSEATPLELTFLRRLRDERKWPSSEALREQIRQDIHAAERFLHIKQLLTAEGRRAPQSVLAR